MSRIIISDIHGCFTTLIALIAKLPKDIPITFAGDYIDRGLDSNKVLEFVKKGGYDCVLGNHEKMMLDDIRFCTDHEGKEYATANGFNIWLMNGGTQTLNSYDLPNGDQDIETLKSHLSWLKILPYYIHYENEIDDKGQSLFVSHSTVSGAWHLPKDDKIFINSALWARKSMPKKIPNIFNVFGHTPVENGPTIKDHFANIDCGAVYRSSVYGKLVALEFPSMKVYEQENIEIDDEEK